MNGPLLSLYGEDTDDSTFMDAYELWLNEIGFLYYNRPRVSGLPEITYVEGETGNDLTWGISVDKDPVRYEITLLDAGLYEEGSTSGNSITINVDGLSASETPYDFFIVVTDALGYTASGLGHVNVTEAPTSTTTTSDGGGGGVPLDPTILIIVGAAGAVIVIVIIFMMKKKK